MKLTALLACVSVLLAGCQNVPHPMQSVLITPMDQSPTSAKQSWRVMHDLAVPEGLRPCCAFGYNLRAEVAGIPVPLYELSNVVEADNLGKHHYNDSKLSILSTLAGFNTERDGLVYTRRGGFIDLAHIRDTADYTLYLFTKIWPKLGQKQDIRFSDELGQRHIKLWAFTPPEDPAQRYTLSAFLAARLAFQLAAWHEVAQWYGFESVPGFSEGVSAFSPEDLYSNLLGARIALNVINSGYASSLSEYARAMQVAIPDALHQLQSVDAEQTRSQFDAVDGLWWNSQCRLPEKYLVRYRNYRTADARWPSHPPNEDTPALYLTLPEQAYGFTLTDLGQLQIWKGEDMENLPVPDSYYTVYDFSLLAHQAESQDNLRALKELKLGRESCSELK